ncbi:hypothetical protein [Endothiovibrio diazotrophicus]
MEIKNVALEQAVAQRQRTDNGGKQAKVEEESRGSQGDRISISAEAELRAEPGSGRIQDPEAARATARQVSDLIGSSGGVALMAHSRVSPQVMQTLGG